MARTKKVTNVLKQLSKTLTNLTTPEPPKPNQSLSDLMSQHTKDIMNARKEMTILVSAANKRLKRFEQAGKEVTEYAYMYKKTKAYLAEKGLTKFSVKGLNTEGLQETYIQLKKFLTAETGTLSGYKRNKRKVEKIIEQKTGVKFSEISTENQTKIWQALNKLREQKTVLQYGAQSGQVITRASAILSDNSKKSVEELTQELAEQLEESYEQEMEQYNEWEKSLQYNEDSPTFEGWD